MKKSTVTLMLVFAFLGGLFFTTSSCKKARLNKATTTDEDNALAESSFDEVDRSASYVAVKEEGVKQRSAEPEFDPLGNECYTVLHLGKNNDTLAYRSASGYSIYDSAKISNTTYFPRTIIIDFGTGCKGNDERTRKGKIKIYITGKFWSVGTIITYTTENYYVNDYRIEGTRKVTHSAAEVWDIVVTGGKITDPDGKMVSWESTRTRTRIAGSGTPINIFDDVYTITGNASGTNREGRNFTVTITTALQLKFCSYIAEIVKGVIKIQPEDLKPRTVDFGDGTCDNEGTVTVGNKTKTFKLRK